MKQTTQPSLFPLFNPVVNDASLFEPNPSKPGILLPFSSWSDLIIQFCSPFLVLLSAIEQCISTPIVVLSSLIQASVFLILNDQNEAIKQLRQGYLAIAYLLHLIPFSVICDFAITLVCCITRPLASFTQALLPNSLMASNSGT